MDRKLYNWKSKKGFRKRLRSQLSPYEQDLWNHLRGRRLEGAKFRRQQGVGPYIVDFYCPEVKLVVEVDGDSHFEDNGAKHDAERDGFMYKNGITILRFTNLDVKHDLESVLNDIMDAVKTLRGNPLQLPLKKGEGQTRND